MSVAIKVVWSVFWFLAAIAISSLAVDLVRAMSGTSYHGYRPIPPGVFISAIVMAVIGWRRAPSPERLGAILKHSAGTLPRQVRFGIALSVPWALAVLGLAFLSDAISARDVSYWRSKEWLRLLGLAFGPPLLGVLTLYLWRWADAPTIASAKPPDFTAPEALVHDKSNSAGSSSGMPSRTGERGVSAADRSTTKTDDDAIAPPSVSSARAKLAAILQQQDDTAVMVPETSESIASSNEFARPRLGYWLRNGALLLIAAIAAYSVLILDPWSQRSIQVLCCHDSSIESVSITEDERLILTGSLDGTVRLWDRLTGSELGNLEQHERGKMSGWISAVLALPGDRFVVASFGETVRIRSAENANGPVLLKTRSGSPRALATTPDARLLVVATGNAVANAVEIFDLATLRAAGILHVPSAVINSVSTSQDGSRVVAAGNDGTVKVWALHNLAEVAHIKIPFAPDEITSKLFAKAVLTPDGKKVAATAGSSVIIWDIDTTNFQVLQSQENVGMATSIAVTPDGTMLIVGYGRGPLRVWDARTGAHITTLKGHADSVESIAVSHAGELIVSGSRDRTTRLWRTPK